MDYTSNQSGSVEHSERKPNVFLGIIGSILGAIIGAALWVVLYQFGIIASIAGIAIIYLSCKGYSLLSKSISIKGVVISVIISILVLVAAHFLCWGMDIYNAFKDEAAITFMDALKSVPSIAFTEELVIGFLRDLAIGLVLIFVGAAPMFRQARNAD